MILKLLWYEVKVIGIICVYETERHIFYQLLDPEGRLAWRHGQHHPPYLVSVSEQNDHTSLPILELGNSRDWEVTFRNHIAGTNIKCRFNQVLVT